MVWFKIDDNMAFHHKIIAAGNAAVGLWARAGAACAQQLTDGFVPDHLAETLGTKAQAARLVSVGLWVRVEGGYRFHEWQDRNPTRAEVEAERAATAKRVRQWRDRRNAVTNAVSNGGGNAVSNAAPSRPDPTRPLEIVKSVCPSPTQGAPEDGLDLERIRRALNGCPLRHAQAAAKEILSRAPSEPRDPTGYVLASIRAANPEEFRYRRGNPTRADECPEHPGEWADACRACQIDQRLGENAK